MTDAPFAALREFVRARESKERCDTCGVSLDAEHAHTFEPESRRISCACDDCVKLYASVRRKVPKRIRALKDFQLSDGQWDDLMIPISLAFFCYSTPAQRWVALYPGPGGAAESLLRIDAWEEVSRANSALSELESDVEALLVNRVGGSREYFLVPIDECYRLVGLIRMHWRGLSGGALVWGEIARFFAELRRKASLCRV